MSQQLIKKNSTDCEKNKWELHRKVLKGKKGRGSYEIIL